MEVRGWEVRGWRLGVEVREVEVRGWRLGGGHVAIIIITRNKCNTCCGCTVYDNRDGQWKRLKT